MPIYIANPQQREKGKVIEIENQRQEIINSLLEFMDYIYIPRNMNSKYGIMGPVGKLINFCKTMGIIDWGQIKGYILNVIRMNQSYNIPTEAIQLLDDVVEKLKLVNQKIQGIEWRNYIDGIDYEFFFQIFKTNKEQKDEFIRSKFIEFLKKKTSKIEDLQDLLFDKTLNFDEIPHPSQVKNLTIVKEFWNDYKASKVSK